MEELPVLLTTCLEQPIIPFQKRCRQKYEKMCLNTYTPKQDAYFRRHVVVGNKFVVSSRRPNNLLNEEPRPSMVEECICWLYEAFEIATLCRCCGQLHGRFCNVQNMRGWSDLPLHCSKNHFTPGSRLDISQCVGIYSKSKAIQSGTRYIQHIH